MRFFFALTYEKLWIVPQIDWFLMIELNYLIYMITRFNDTFFLSYK